MRTNSIISDPEPYVPALSGKPAVKSKPTDFENIANGEDFPQFTEYIKGRITHYQKFLPSTADVKGMTTEQRVAGWDNAVVIIGEFEGLLNTLHAFRRK